MASDNEFINTISSMAGISILGAISRTVLSEDRRSFAGFCRALICAIFVALLMGNLISDYKLTDGEHNLVIGVSSFLADDILMLILKFSSIIMKNPSAALDWVINFLTGLKHK